MSAIGFKNLKVLKGMFTLPWHPQLIKLLMWLVVRVSKDKITITSAYRKGDKGVHGTVPLRAFDIRSKSFDSPESICLDVNKTWTYDPARPEKTVALYHQSVDKNGKSKGWHIHLQVHNDTK